MDQSASQLRWGEVAVDERWRRATAEAVMAALASDQGAAVAAFENALAAEFGYERVVAVNSGSAALHLALVVAGVQSGDEVILATHGPVGPAAAITLTGARPVFADIESAGLCVDPSDVATRVGPRTRAIIASHVHGQIADIPALLRVCEKSGAMLIEDATDSVGAVLNGEAIGSQGRIGFFSFSADAALASAAGGGALVTTDGEVADRAALLRDNGRVAEHYHLEPGFEYGMSVLQAAMLTVELQGLAQRTASRQVAAGVYATELGSAPITLPGAGVYHRFVIRTRYREALHEYLKEEAIPAEVPYATPLHLQPAFLGSAAVGDLPRAEAASREVLRLPLYAEMPMEELMTVVRAVRQFGKFSAAMARESAAVV